MSQSEDAKPDLAPERVEIGMEIAFGAEGESVLDALERLTGVRSRVLLNDPVGDDTPVVRVTGEDSDDAPSHEHRYEVLGEIARGGVGVILKSRDRDLGRDVALKVLRKDLAQVPEVVQRFVEEAQIEGQLQHPGVVPVYGLGVQKDGRPYFAMKLVKGRTLAALIRDGNASDRSRFLSVFERICQTVAYAHARNVIHRDIKPANVLVGAFGEIQVVDWGFAKVLGQGGVADEHREEVVPDLSLIETVRSGSGGSMSQVGSVMGTPAYMPPEQARGDVAKLDERADVFSLGAVLLEILTGKPPYVGSGGEQLRAAAGAKLDDAKARLAQSGADPELVDLAERCLAPARDARPRHAGEVAEAITAYLASLDEKKRAAELRAASLQRTRRLTVALAAAILLAVTLGGGGLLVADRAERDRLERAGAAVNGALQEAGVLLGEARATDVEDLSRWPVLSERADAAVALAEDLGAGEEVKAATEAFRAEVTADEAKARRTAAVAAEDRELSRILWDVRLYGKPYTLPADEPPFHPGIGGYGDALRTFGLDVDDASVEEVARWVTARTIQTQIVEAMDDWVHRLRAEGLDTARLSKALAIADPDPARGRIRAASAEGKRETLARIRHERPLGELPMATLRLLAEALGLTGDPAGAVDVYRVAAERDPYDFATCARLAAWLVQRPPAGTQEALSLLSRAAALRKDCAAVRRILANLYSNAQMPEAALATTRELFALAPEAGRTPLLYALGRRAVLYRRAQDPGAAAEALREAVAIDGENANYWGVLADSLVAAGRAVEAEEAAQKALEIQPSHPVAHRALADALRIRGRREASLASYDRSLEIHPGASQSWRDKGKALAGMGRLEDAIECWENAIEAQPGHHEFYQFIGLACLRLGRVDAAVKNLEEACRLFPEWSTGPAFLATAHLEGGDVEAARSALDEAVELACRAVTSPRHRMATGGDPHAQLGFILGRRYGVDEAVAFWEKRFPSAGTKAKVSVLHALANVARVVRLDPEGARRLIDEVIRLAPDDHRGHMEMGFLLAALGDTEGSLASMRRAVEVSGGARYTISSLRLALEGAGRYREVVELTRRQAEVDPRFEEQVLTFKRYLDLQERVEEILGGVLEPADPKDHELFSAILLHAGHAQAAYVRSLGWHESRPRKTERRAEVEALTHAHWQVLYIAAVAHAAADDGEKTLWRERTLEHLARWTELMEESSRYLRFPEDGIERRSGKLAHQMLHPHWAFLRDDTEIAKLPLEERETCRDLWSRIRALVEKVP